MVIQGFKKRSILQWEDPEYTAFDSQSTSQIIAEIDPEVNLESRLKEREIQIRKSTRSQFLQSLGETENLKVLTFVETITSMSGAVIVPDLAANPVGQDFYQTYARTRVERGFFFLPFLPQTQENKQKMPRNGTFFFSARRPGCAQLW